MRTELEASGVPRGDGFSCVYFLFVGSSNMHTVLGSAALEAAVRGQWEDDDVASVFGRVRIVTCLRPSQLQHAGVARRFL